MKNALERNCGDLISSIDCSMNDGEITNEQLLKHIKWLAENQEIIVRLLNEENDD